MRDNCNAYHAGPGTVAAIRMKHDWMHPRFCITSNWKIIIQSIGRNLLTDRPFNFIGGIFTNTINGF